MTIRDNANAYWIDNKDDIPVWISFMSFFTTAIWMAYYYDAIVLKLLLFGNVCITISFFIWSLLLFLSQWRYRIDFYGITYYNSKVSSLYSWRHITLIYSAQEQTGIRRYARTFLHLDSGNIKELYGINVSKRIKTEVKYYSDNSIPVYTVFEWRRIQNKEKADNQKARKK